MSIELNTKSKGAAGRVGCGGNEHSKRKKEKEKIIKKERRQKHNTCLPSTNEGIIH